MFLSPKIIAAAEAHKVRVLARFGSLRPPERRGLILGDGAREELDVRRGLAMLEAVEVLSIEDAQKVEWRVLADGPTMAGSGKPSGGMSSKTGRKQRRRGGRKPNSTGMSRIWLGWTDGAFHRGSGSGCL